MKKCYEYNENNGERYMITISSSATKDSWEDSFTAETGGYCIGPADLCDGCDEHYAEFVAGNWESFEEMEDDEEEERIQHLAEEWGLDESDLEYLR